MKTLFEMVLSPELLELGKQLVSQVDPKYLPAFERLAEEERAKAGLYFIPHGSKKDVLSVSRPRVLKWYGPFADQTVFPSGVRYCLNVYTGCEHKCRYCYVNGYSLDNPAKCKSNFRNDLLKDLDDVEKYDLPAIPLHLSNSTDAFQEIESEFQNTLFALKLIPKHRKRFTTVTILTKNPAIPAKEEYLERLKDILKIPEDHPKRDHFKKSSSPPLVLECSLAFWNDEARKLLDPSAPSVENRLESIRKLRKSGIPVSLRIDPLFPRNPLPGGERMEDFALTDVQPLEDIESLVRFAKEIGAYRIIYSILKITKPRSGSVPEEMQKLLDIFSLYSETTKAEFRGNAWRVPEKSAREFVAPIKEICDRYGIEAKMCKENLLETI